MQEEIKDKIIVISGGSEGLGKSIANRLVAGNKIIILARSEEKLKETADQIHCDFRVCDISDYQACDSTIKSIIENYGRVDVLINNAGIWIEGELAENDPQQIERVIRTNTIGTIFLTRAALPFMLRQANSFIVNIVSIAGLIAKEKRSVYSASKWAITGFTKSLISELSPKGIKVVGIYPTYMNTSLFEGYPNTRDPAKALDTDEVAETVAFILSRKPKTHIVSVEIKNIDY